jgi:antitoxin ParD1/3/4
MAPMNISLTPELERYIAQKVESGNYQTASEVVREALRLLIEQDQLNQLKLEDLRREVQKGIDSLKGGRGIPADQVLSRLRKRAEERVKKSKARK